MAQPINIHLYRLLVKQGASEDEAELAARVDASELVTKGDLLILKADLHAELQALETRLQRFIIQAMLGMTAIFAFIVGLFRIFT